MTTINTPTKRTLPLDQITPYWRNPRRIPGDAIKSVRESLERYGYQQPIVVDEHNVIVVGHTRYYAMQQMDIDEVEVYVTNLPEDKV
jgi:ParB-like chromosome segregation protein Spo0J